MAKACVSDANGAIALAGPGLDGALLTPPGLHYSLNDCPEELSEQCSCRLLCQPLAYRFQSLHCPSPHQFDFSDRAFGRRSVLPACSVSCEEMANDEPLQGGF